MLIDVLNSNNYISYNITIAQVYGLHAAIYVSELLNIYKKVQIKNKFVHEDYFKVDRRYVFKRTTLTADEQLVVEQNLMKLDIITRDEENVDVIKFDFEKLVSLSICDDIKKVEAISKKVSTDKPKGIRATKRDRAKQALKDGIVCNNYELLTAFRNWIDTLYESPHVYLGKTVVEEFVKAIMDYCKTDYALGVKVVKLAAIQGYKNAQFAISLYEKDTKRKEGSKVDTTRRINRVTTQKVTSTEDVDGDIIF